MRPRSGPILRPWKRFDEWSLPADFEYKVTDEANEHQAHCPFCRHEMKREDVLCLNCGFNRKTGEKVETKTGDEAVFDDQKKASAGSVSFGGLSLPLPMLLGAGGGLLAIVIVLLIFAPGVLAVLLVSGGALAIMVGHLWVILVAFQEDAMQGLLAWFVPIYWWVYAFSRLDSVALPFFVTLAGWLMMFFGVGIACSGGGSEAEETVGLAQLLMMSRPFV